MGYNPFQTLARNVSSLGSFLRIPNAGFSGTIASGNPQQVVQPYLGLSSNPTFSGIRNQQTSGQVQGVSTSSIPSLTGSSGQPTTGFGSLSTPTSGGGPTQNTQQAPSNGGGGGGGGGGINTNSAQSATDAELSQALSELDYQRGNLLGQQEQLGTQKTSALSDIESAFGRSQKQAETSKEEATSATLSAKSKALGTAQDVQRKNRNTLRALGILSSSAAGEMLINPINEFGKQAADLEQSLVTRKNYIDTWLQDRIAEHQTAVRDIEKQFTELVGKIQNDLRFNDRQRSDAVRNASAAFQARVQQIQQSAQQYQLTAKNFNNQVLQQVAALQTYNNPQANTGAIQNQLLSTTMPEQQQRNDVQIYQPNEDIRRRLSG